MAARKWLCRAGRYRPSTAGRAGRRGPAAALAPAGWWRCSLGEATIDPIVLLLLIGNGEREDFLFGELGKAFHSGLVIDAISSVLVPCLLRLRRVWRRHSDDAHHSFILMTQDMAVEHEGPRYIATKIHEQPNLAGRYRIVL